VIVGDHQRRTAFNKYFSCKTVAFLYFLRLIIKAPDMKNSTQQEVLLITGTTFSSSQLSKKDESKPNSLTDIEQLEEACWNGLLQEMLPEIFDKTIADKKSYLWQIKEGKSFLELEWAESPVEKDNFFSIDPYDFLEAENYN
jgi:hypothetical protein